MLKQERTGKSSRAGGYGAEMPAHAEVDFENIHKSFEQFFGFHPETKDVTNEEKLKPKTRQKNPLDTSKAFEQFMGIKR